MSSNYLKNLNPAQKEAVLATEGPLLVLAGAGAGKTKTIAERIRHLVHRGASPSSILAITFTNKATGEMRERISKGLSEDRNINLPIEMGERPFVSTFHSLGVRILREQFAKLGIKKFFTIFDKDDSKKAVKEALEQSGLDPKTHEPGRILSIISKEKGKGITVENYRSREEKGYFSNIVEGVWVRYEEILKRDGALDFDDLLLKTRDLLRDNSEVRKYYQSIWQYILVDEYQDTNRVQYEISKMLVGERKNICVVGDIDQNIYSWRGADIKNILDFEKDYPEAKVVVLEENYRSTKTILGAANAVIEKNIMRRDKNLITQNAFGEKISLYVGYDEANEADFIAQKASELIKKGSLPEQIAVLYRANFQSRALEEAFMRSGVPYQILGTRFFERKEVKDILAYLRAALNPDSLSDLKRIINVPARGIGKTTVAKIFSGTESSLPAETQNKISKFRNLLVNIAKIAEERKPSETIHYIIHESGFEKEWQEGGKDNGADRMENAYELANFASRYDNLSGEEAIIGFLSDAALQSDQDEMCDDRSVVRLLTVHSSKGLEFDVVFVAGLEDGLFPHQKIYESNISPEEGEEERRLFYVALTRARKKIYLSYAQIRSVFGRREINIPSEFIFDIPEELVEDELFEENHQPRKSLLDIEF
ncbi:MAG: UvrD-helicase domain-containing protein [bacterium]